MIFLEYINRHGHRIYLGYGRDAEHAAEVAVELAAEAGVRVDDIEFSTTKES